MSPDLNVLTLILTRECAIKFNDYFEFPRELDMAPYTVQGLAKIEGQLPFYFSCLSELLVCYVV